MNKNKYTEEHLEEVINNIVNRIVSGDQVEALTLIRAMSQESELVERMGLSEAYEFVKGVRGTDRVTIFFAVRDLIRSWFPAETPNPNENLACTVGGFYPDEVTYMVEVDDENEGWVLQSDLKYDTPESARKYVDFYNDRYGEHRFRVVRVSTMREVVP